jgi:hypothetical protein
MPAFVCQTRVGHLEDAADVVRTGIVTPNVCSILNSTHFAIDQSSGQNFQWQMHHKRLCKVYNSYVALPKYQALQDHEKLDSVLLSHLLARLSLQTNPYSFPDSHPASTLLSLLPERGNFNGEPFFCPIIPPPPGDLADQLYSRFGNNNFAIHSHLTSIGHGIFPVASRLFNHSCVPNVAVKYIFREAQNVIMDIIALRDILPDEEVGLCLLRTLCLCSRSSFLVVYYLP